MPSFGSYAVNIYFLISRMIPGIVFGSGLFYHGSAGYHTCDNLRDDSLAGRVWLALSR